MLARRRVELPRRLRVGHGCAVAERPDVRRALDAEGLVDDHPATVVERDVERRERRGSAAHRRPRRACVPGCAYRRRAPPRARRTTGERRLDMDLDRRVARARGACTRRACAGSPGGSAERRRRAPSAARTPRSVGYERRMASLGEVVQLGERLDARVARADEDEAEVALRLARVEPGRGRLERAEEPVAQRDRVGDVLEPEPVLGEPGDGERPRHGAERDDEPLVADLERTAERLGDDRPRSRRRARRPGRGGARRAGTSAGAERPRASARACPPPPPRAGAACRA